MSISVAVVDKPSLETHAVVITKSAESGNVHHSTRFELAQFENATQARLCAAAIRVALAVALIK